MDLGHSKVDAELIKLSEFNIPTTSDIYGFLKGAATAFILAFLCQVGIITQTSGEIMTNKFGEVTYQYQKTNPMFFFATGSSKPFQELIPYETLRMHGYAYIRAYKKLMFYTRTGQKRPIKKLARDKTSRGAFWNVDYTENDVADAEYGETLTYFYGDDE